MYSRSATRKLQKEKENCHRAIIYFSLRSRLQTLFMTKEMALNMWWHESPCAKGGVLGHPTDSKAWDKFDASYVDFSIDP